MPARAHSASKALHVDFGRGAVQRPVMHIREVRKVEQVVRDQQVVGIARRPRASMDAADRV
jgi:spermidine synthase